MRCDMETKRMNDLQVLSEGSGLSRAQKTVGFPGAGMVKLENLRR